MTCTPEHPWHTDTGWVLAGNLAVGTSILTRAGPSVVVQSVTKTHSDAGILVYNFLVADDHTYFVGNQDEWVHNGPIDCGKLYDKIALGQFRNQKLARFTKAMGDDVSNYNMWDPRHFGLADNDVEGLILNAMKKAKVIYFNLDGVDIEWVNRDGSDPSPPGAEWELKQILSDPSLYEKMLFGYHH